MCVCVSRGYFHFGYVRESCNCFPIKWPTGPNNFLIKFLYCWNFDCGHVSQSTVQIVYLEFSVLYINLMRRGNTNNRECHRQQLLSSILNGFLIPYCEAHITTENYNSTIFLCFPLLLFFGRFSYSYVICSFPINQLNLKILIL